MIPFTTSPAHAADGEDEASVATLRTKADAIANRYFDALARHQALDREIATTEQIVDQLAARARKAREDARARAQSAYRTAASRLSSIADSEDVLAAARRVQLIDLVNARDQGIFLRARATAKELEARRNTLEATRQEQAVALAQLRDEGASMDAKLAIAQQREQAARVAAEAAAARAAQPVAPATAPPANTAQPKPAAPSPPPDYEGSPGMHPRHDDPFLTCVRARESGGNYSVVNPAGPYYGAYQFLQSTWNATANHAGRTNLVGVPPNLATSYDQDDMAWALYQWQGSRPWGGACD